jgi:hypothetical protein
MRERLSRSRLISHRRRAAVALLIALLAAMVRDVVYLSLKEAGSLTLDPPLVSQLVDAGAFLSALLLISLLTRSATEALALGVVVAAVLQLYSAALGWLGIQTTAAILAREAPLTFWTTGSIAQAAVWSVPLLMLFYLRTLATRRVAAAATGAGSPA